MEDDLEIEMLREIADAFRRLPQYNFLWKFKGTKFPFNVSSNVMTLEWLPQNDLLAHANVKAFITHGGLSSVMEAIHYGVPMICLPLYGEQRTVN